MKKFEWAKEFERKEEERKNNPGTPYFRSYFNGYGLIEKDSGDGLVRNEFTYSGLLYCFDGSPKARFLRKIFHLLMILAAVGIVVLLGAQQGDLNNEKLFALPFFACVLITVIRFFSVIFYLISPMKMREWDFIRAVKRYRLFCLISAATGIMGFFITLILGLINKDFSVSFVLSLAGFAAFAADAIIIISIEKVDDYSIIPAAEVFFDAGVCQ